MPPRMTTKSAGWGDGRIDGQGGQVGGQGDQGRGQRNGRNQNGDAVNDNIQGDVGNIIENNDRMGCTYKEFLDCNPKEYDGTEPKTIQKAVQTAGILTDEALRNGSIKKNPEKKRNRGEPSKDRNVRDDNKRNRTGNAFATTTNPVKREITGTVPKCTTYNTYHPPEAPCRTCFNYNHPGHLLRIVEWCLEKARQDPNLVTGTFTQNDHYATTLFDSGADYSFVSTTCIPLLDIKHSDLGFSYEIEIASGKLVEVDKVIRGCKLEIDVRIPLLDGKVLRVLEENLEEKMRQSMSAEAKEKKQEEIVVVRDFPKVFSDDLSGLSPVQEIKFQIELVPGAMLVAKSPYHLAPSKLEELSGELKELQDKVQFLRHVINGDGIHVDPSKIEAANVVANALSRKDRVKPKRVRAMNMTLRSSIKDEMIERRSDGALYYLDRIWVPLKGDVRTLIMEEAHKMYYDLRVRYWWPEMKKDIAMYEGIEMDFVTKLPRTSSGHDTIWVIVDRLTKFAHFLPMHEDYKMDRLARLYLNEIVARHDMPISIISDRDSRFISRFWQSMQEALGIRLDMSTAYHPQIDSQSERTIQTLEDMLRACVLDFEGKLRCSSSVEFGEGHLIGPELVQKTTEKISQIKDRLKAACDRQKSYADMRRKPLEFSVGDYVLLKVSPWKGVVRFEKKGKLAPRFIGQFEVIEKVGPVAYRSVCGNLREREFKKLKRSRIAIVKVRWNSKRGPEFTWEHEDQMKLKAAAVASHTRVLELDTHSSSEADPSESSPPPVSVAPMVSPFLCSDDSKAAAVASHTRVLELDTHSSSEADPSESSPPPVSVAPMVSPFLCSDDSKSDTEIPERHVSLTTSTLEILTSLILLASSIIVAPSSEFLLAPIVVPPEIHRRRATLIRPEEDIPIGRLYRTHPGRPCKALTTRNSVRPLPSHRLALSSSHSSSGHTPPYAIDADSSTPQRLVHPPLARTPRCSTAYLHWRSTPLSTMYPSTTFESSVRNSLSKSSAGPSRKRCRYHVATVTSSIHARRALVPSRADLLPPHKRFRDSFSPEDSVEEDIDTDVLEDIEADATAVEFAVDSDVEAGIDAGIGMEVDVGIDVEDEVEDEVESCDRGTMEVGVDMDAGIDIPNGMLMPDVVKRLEPVEEGLQDIYDHVIEIPLQRIKDIETVQRQLEAGQLIASGERDGLFDRTRSLERENLKVRELLSIERDRVDSLRCHMALSQEYFCQNTTITRSGMTPEAIKELVNRRVEEALAAYEATHTANALDAENKSQNGSDGDNGNGGNENSDNGNGENRNGRNENPNENGKGDRPVAKECTYQDFMKCQPLNFKGKKGVVGLTRWFEKMETVFHISNCQEKY
nr:hypothetical protein [Tanacetum cinerariifolium]